MWFFWMVWGIGLALILAYAFVLPFGAPFIPTHQKQSDKVFDLLRLKPGQLFIDLGSGDGRLLVAAAERNLQAVGYELNPFLWFYSWLRTRRYGRRVKVRLANFWRADLECADGVFVFLIGHRMKRLDRVLAKQSANRQIKLVSHAFKIPGKKPLKKSGAMYLYVYGTISNI